MAFGYIVSLKKKMIKRIFEENRDVLILATQRSQLKNGTKLLFYNPLPISAAIGEATIHSTSYGKANEILKLINRTIQSEIELQKYFDKTKVSFSNRKERSENNFMIIEFKNIEKYPEPKKLHKTMVPSGFYITKEEYTNIVQ